MFNFLEFSYELCENYTINDLLLQNTDDLVSFEFMRLHWTIKFDVIDVNQHIYLFDKKL